jgi:hypothetical protein
MKSDCQELNSADDLWAFNFMKAVRLCLIYDGNQNETHITPIVGISETPGLTLESSFNC